jgi:bifunctional non-homologous end joining protein LigD
MTTIEVSSPEKKLFSHYTKKDYMEYYEHIASLMLPHVEKRPLTMYRFPDGAENEGFYQKDKSDYFPTWLDHIRIPHHRGSVDYVVCNTNRSILYVASQIAEFHVWTSTTDRLGYPDKMVFDLDPSGTDLERLRKIIRKLRVLLIDIGLQPYLMTTGKRGYHVVVPLNPEQENNKVREFALKVAVVLEQDDPTELTTELIKEKRGQRIFIDVNRNSSYQTSIAPYSVRAVPTASVALPLSWEELGRIKPADYDLKKTMMRMSRKLDPWRRFRGESASLLEITKRLKQ